MNPEYPVVQVPKPELSARIPNNFSDSYIAVTIVCSFTEQICKKKRAHQLRHVRISVRLYVKIREPLERLHEI